ARLDDQHDCACAFRACSLNRKLLAVTVRGLAARNRKWRLRFSVFRFAQRPIVELKIRNDENIITVFALRSSTSRPTCPVMRAKDYRAIGEKQGTPARFPLPKPKPDMARPIQNLRNALSVPTTKFPHRVNLPDEF